MSDNDSDNILPQHRSGAQTNTKSSIELDTIEEAKSFYQKVKQRLLQVNNWQQIAGTLTAKFQLTNEQGKAVNRTAQKQDHFKIDIPGPGSITGDGFDWVQVEDIEETETQNEQSITIRVRPATNPTNAKKDVAHFFSEEATSCFTVKRELNTITAGVYGRNEKPNTDAETLTDKARNTAVATGAISGFAKLQWKSLVNGLVKKD